MRDAAAGGRVPVLPRRGLVGLVGLGVLSQALIQVEAFTANPVVLVPQSDAAVLWERAGEIAGGAVVDDMPFDTAPMIVWVAAAVRALGGGLAAFGALQSALHVLTAALIAAGAARVAAGLGGAAADGGPAPGAGAEPLDPGLVGLSAGALYLLLDEPAAATSRVLGTTLQLFLASWLLFLVAGGPRRPGPARAAGTGLVLGATCLAYPPALGALPFLGLWAWRASGPAAAGAALLAAAAAVAPATAHNLAASGEPVLISSQAGLTFYHGNNPGADGRIAPVGVVNEKATQARDSLARARAELGPGAGWRDASAHWRARGLAWWAEEPVRASGIALRKLWYALTARRYGDVYQPWRERRDGVAAWLWLAPVPVAWIMPLALVVLVGLARRRRGGELALFVALPVAVCVAFFYSPRYRAPAIVGAVPLAALALARLARSRGVGAPGPATAGPLATCAALALGVVAGPLNRSIGLDTDPEGRFELRHIERMATAHGALGDHAAGRDWLARLLELDPADPVARSRVAKLDLFLLGDEARALEVLRGAPPAARSHPGIASLEALVLASARDADVADAGRALVLADGLLEALGGAPGLLDLKAMALARLGRFDEARALADQALSMLTGGDPLRTEITARRSLYVAGQPYLQPGGDER